MLLDQNLNKIVNAERNSFFIKRREERQMKKWMREQVQCIRYHKEKGISHEQKTDGQWSCVSKERKRGERDKQNLYCCLCETYGILGFVWTLDF